MLRTIPDQHWAPKEVPGLVDNLVGYLSAIPAQFRTAGPATDAIALAKALSSKLPADQAKAITDRLENLDVRVIAIGTVVERMIYDKETIAVQAGERIESSSTGRSSGRRDSCACQHRQLWRRRHEHERLHPDLSRDGAGQRA